MQLYGYWRSSAAYRVRIALNLKAIAYQSMPVHLIQDGGQQHSEEYTALNPTHLVPTLVDGDFVLNQSMAIIEYLDSQYPEVKLIPSDAKHAAQARALAYDIACEVHPLNNLRVQQFLSQQLEVNDEKKQAWVDHWMSVGFAAFEQQVIKSKGKYCVGDEVTIADLCLVPQIYNAQRFNVDLTPFPETMEIVERCRKLPAFISASPEQQSDAQ